MLCRIGFCFDENKMINSMQQLRRQLKFCLYFCFLQSNEGMLCCCVIAILSVPFFLSRNLWPKLFWIWQFLCRLKFKRDKTKVNIDHIRSVV